MILLLTVSFWDHIVSQIKVVIHLIKYNWRIIFKTVIVHNFVDKKYLYGQKKICVTIQTIHISFLKKFKFITPKADKYVSLTSNYDPFCS